MGRGGMYCCTFRHEMGALSSLLGVHGGLSSGQAWYAAGGPGDSWLCVCHGFFRSLRVEFIIEN